MAAATHCHSQTAELGNRPLRPGAQAGSRERPVPARYRLPPARL